MSTLARQRCLNHAEREAAARCPGCGQSYCRECVVEHGERMLCAACVRLASARQAERAGWLSAAWRAAQAAAGVFFLWVVFFAAGRILLAIPASFHEGEVWKRFAE